MDILRHQETVAKVARHYAGLGLDVKDLEQIGWLAIIQNYKPGYKVWLCVKHAVVRALHAQVNTIRLPEYLITRDTKISRGEVRGLSPLQVARAENAVRNRRADAFDYQMVLQDVYVPYDYTADYICEHFHLLTDRERYVIERNFGLNGHDEMSLEVIAPQLGIGRSMASKLKQAALRKLRAQLEEKI